MIQKAVNPSPKSTVGGRKGGLKIAYLSQQKLLSGVVQMLSLDTEEEGKLLVLVL